jgi:hypothetical protein
MMTEPQVEDQQAQPYVATHSDHITGMRLCDPTAPDGSVCLVGKARHRLGWCAFHSLSRDRHDSGTR